MLQGEKFDPNGDYVRRWVPELAGLPAGSSIGPGQPIATLPPEIYPERIVDHAAARDRALVAFRGLRSAGLRPSS